MLEMILIGMVCALVVALLLTRQLGETEPETHDFDDARLDSIRAELDVQEMKTRKVRAGA